MKINHVKQNTRAKEHKIGKRVGFDHKVIQYLMSVNVEQGQLTTTAMHRLLLFLEPEGV
jgi:hypothetical protein